MNIIEATGMIIMLASFAMAAYGLRLQRTEVSEQNKEMIELLRAIRDKTVRVETKSQWVKAYNATKGYWRNVKV